MCQQAYSNTVVENLSFSRLVLEAPLGSIGRSSISGFRHRALLLRTRRTDPPRRIPSGKNLRTGPFIRPPRQQREALARALTSPAPRKISSSCTGSLCAWTLSNSAIAVQRQQRSQPSQRDVAGFTILRRSEPFRVLFGVEQQVHLTIRAAHLRLSVLRPEYDHARQRRRATRVP